jgi:hypothetical protein
MLCYFVDMYHTPVYQIARATTSVAVLLGADDTAVQRVPLRLATNNIQGNSLLRHCGGAFSLTDYAQNTRNIK